MPAAHLPVPPPATAVGTHSVHIGRQPIYDGAGALHAYELLFRAHGGARAAGPAAGPAASPAAGPAGDVLGDQATTATILAAFSEFALPDLLGGRPGFVNLTRAFLVGQLPVPFDPEVAVLEVLESVPLDDEVVAGVARLRGQGYHLALDDFVWQPRADVLLDQVSIVKVDVLAQPWPEVLDTVARCRRPGVRLLAEKVEDADMLARCREAGFTLFQGHHLGRPQTLTAESLSADHLLALRLLAELSDPDVDLGKIETILRPDPGLTLRLLRLANSSASGVTRTVSSITDAVVLVGLQRLRGWMVLMALGGRGTRPEGLAAALARAQTCELLARSRRESGVRPDVAFTLGLLDGIGSALGMATVDLLGGLPPLAQPLDAALRGEPSPLRSILDAVLVHETAGPDSAVLAADVATNYLAALAWTTRTFGQVGGGAPG